MTDKPTARIRQDCLKSASPRTCQICNTRMAIDWQVFHWARAFEVLGSRCAVVEVCAVCADLDNGRAKQQVGCPDCDKAYAGFCADIAEASQMPL